MESVIWEVFAGSAIETSHGGASVVDARAGLTVGSCVARVALAIVANRLSLCVVNGVASSESVTRSTLTGIRQLARGAVETVVAVALELVGRCLGAHTVVVAF